LKFGATIKVIIADELPEVSTVAALSEFIKDL
jgi:hypothetical protein